MLKIKFIERKTLRKLFSRDHRKSLTSEQMLLFGLFPPCGAYSPLANTIYIQTDIKFMGKVSIFIHEFGHYLACKLGYNVKIFIKLNALVDDIGAKIEGGK